MTNIPTIQDLFNDILAALEAEFDISANPLGQAFLVGLAGVLSGLLYLYYLAIGDTQKNIWPDTADSEANGGTLERFGRSILGRSPFPATPGQYTCSVTGTIGAQIKAGTVWRSDDSSENPGMLFQLNGGAYTIVSGSNTIVINALAGGLTSRLAIGDTLTVTAPLVNVNSSITVTIEDVTPIDAEDSETYRKNILEKIQTEPGSWNAVDYRLVGTGIAGVGETYAYNHSGQSATVDVWLQGTTPVAYPGPSVSPTVISNYQTALALVLPLGVWQVNVAASPINNIDVIVTMGGFPAFTTAQQTDIENALRDFVNSVHPFIAAADNIADRNDVIATFNLSSAITQAVPGYGFSAVTFTVNSTAMATWTADQGNIPFFNSVNFV